MKLKGFLLLIFGLISALTYGQGFSVSPSRITLKGRPGQTVSQIITFSNDGNSNISLIASVKDFYRDSTGVKHYSPAGSRASSNGNWISFSEGALELKKNEKKSLTLTMTIPPDESATSLTNSMVFFTQVKEQTSANQGSGVAINVLMEVGVQVYHVPEGLRSEGLEFIAFEDKGFVAQSRQVAIKLRNPGQLNQDAYVRFELTGIETGEEIPVDAVPVAMLPKAEQWIIINLPASLKGRYLAVAILDAGRQYDLKVAEKEILY